MHPLRHFIRIVELNDVSTGTPPPPTMVDDPGRRGENSGKYWFRNHEKLGLVAVSPTDYNIDFAMQPLTRYKEFGFQPQQIIAWMEQHNHYALESFKMYLANPSEGIWNNSGTRNGSISYAISQGWAYIEYNEQDGTIWLDAHHAKAVVSSAGSMFPMMGMERIGLVLPRSSADAFVNKTVSFFKDDYSGFAGAYGGLMQWAKDGTVPVQNWVYTMTDQPVGSAGLVGEPLKYVYIGNATYRNVFYIRYFTRNAVRLMKGEKGTMYRFPVEIANNLSLRQAGSNMGDLKLFSQEPFTIPADLYNAGRWLVGRQWLDAFLFSPY